MSEDDQALKVYRDNIYSRKGRRDRPYRRSSDDVDQFHRQHKDVFDKTGHATRFEPFPSAVGVNTTKCQHHIKLVGVELLPIVI